MAGARRKSPNSLAGHRTVTVPALAIIAGAGEGDIPALPPGRWLKATKTLWEQYWRSAISLNVDRDSDWPLIEQWIRDVDERTRAMRQLAAEGRTTTGSTGQTVLNPLARYIHDLSARIRYAEQQLGIGPLSRARLGWQIKQLDPHNGNHFEEDLGDDVVWVER